MQPFVTYTTPDAWSFGLNTESTYDWQNRQWTVSLNATVGKVTKLGGQLLSFTGGVGYWAEGPDAAPTGWGTRFVGGLAARQPGGDRSLRRLLRVSSL